MSTYEDRCLHLLLPKINIQLLGFWRWWALDCSLCTTLRDCQFPLDSSSHRCLRCNQWWWLTAYSKVVLMSGSAVIGVQCEQERAEHTALGGSHCWGLEWERCVFCSVATHRWRLCRDVFVMRMNRKNIIINHSQSRKSYLMECASQFAKSLINVHLKILLTPMFRAMTQNKFSCWQRGWNCMFLWHFPTLHISGATRLYFWWL